LTIRKRKLRDGSSRLFIEIRYRTVEGRKERYRRDAQVQTKGGAEAEQRRLLAELAKTGTLAHVAAPSQPEQPVHRFTFSDAVRHFRATKLGTLKPSTRFSYENRLDSLLVPRFGEKALADLTGDTLTALDAELAADGLKASTRQKVHIVFRSVVRLAVTAGLLTAAPTLPRIPRVGRKMVRPFHRDDLDAILAKAAPQARLAFALAAFSGLRAGEVRGLRWSDLDLKGNTLTVRRALTRGEATTPKSGDQRVIPIAAPLRLLLDAAESSRSSPWASVATTALGKPWGESGRMPGPCPRSLPKAKVASSILAGSAKAKAANNNENASRFRRFAWCGTAMRGSGTRRTATLGDGQRRGAWQWRGNWSEQDPSVCPRRARRIGGRDYFRSLRRSWVSNSQDVDISAGSARPSVQVDGLSPYDYDGIAMCSQRIQRVEQDASRDNIQFIHATPPRGSHPFNERLGFRRPPTRAREQVCSYLTRRSEHKAVTLHSTLKNERVSRSDETDICARVGLSKTKHLRSIGDVVHIDRCEARRGNGSDLRSRHGTGNCMNHFQIAEGILYSARIDEGCRIAATG